MDVIERDAEFIQNFRRVGSFMFINITEGLNIFLNFSILIVIVCRTNYHGF